MYKKIISAILFFSIILLINGCQPPEQVQPQEPLGDEMPHDDVMEDTGEAMEETSEIVEDVNQDISGIDEIDQDLDDSELEDLDAVLEDIENI